MIHDTLLALDEAAFAADVAGLPEDEEKLAEAEVCCWHNL